MTNTVRASEARGSQHNVIPITVDMSTLETVLGDLNLRSAAGPTGWTYRLIREFWDLGDRVPDAFKHATLKIVGLIAQGAVGLGDPDGERGGESAFSYLSRACRLAALPKPDGSPRTIAVTPSTVTASQHAACSNSSTQSASITRCFQTSLEWALRAGWSRSCTRYARC